MLEQKKLDEFLQVINENLKELREKKKEVDQENKELYDAYMDEWLLLMVGSFVFLNYL